MAYTIDDYKKQYEAAKAKGDTAGMDAAHKAADALRGYKTTTVKDSTGAYKQVPVVDPSTPGALKNTGVTPTPAPATPANQNSSKSGSTSTGAKVSVQKADGTKAMGTVVDGKTVLDNGQSLKQGDSVVINGIKYTYDEKAGRGLTDSEIASGKITTPTVQRPASSGIDPAKPLDQQGTKVTIRTADGKNKTGYIVGGATYYADGTRLKNNDSVVSTNGVRYTYVDSVGRGLTDEEYQKLTGNLPPAALESPQMNDVDDLIRLIMNEVGTDSPALEQFLSWAEAQAMASERYNPMYNKALHQQMSAIDEKALKTGFYGQLPTEALKRQATASAESERYAAIMELANALVSSSKDDAMTNFNAKLSEKENRMNQLLTLLGVYQDERGYADDRADAAAKLVSDVGSKTPKTATESLTPFTPAEVESLVRGFEMTLAAGGSYTDVASRIIELVKAKKLTSYQADSITKRLGL